MSKDAFSFQLCRGLTLMELLIVIAIVALLAALLFPAVSVLRNRAQAAGCIGNLKQISAASMAYSADNDGEWVLSQLSPNATFANSLIEYLGEPPRRGDPRFRRSVFVCPADHSNNPDTNWSYMGIYTTGSQGYGLSYAQNIYATQKRDNQGARSFSSTRRTGVERPGQMMLYSDWRNHFLAGPGTMNDERRELLAQRHGGLWNMAFVDGSVRAMDPTEIFWATADFPNPFWQGRGEFPQQE